MKKISNTIMSDQDCTKCGKSLKLNLINKIPDASLCYKCNRIANGKPAEHVARAKRISAGLPVH